MCTNRFMWNKWLSLFAFMAIMAGGPANAAYICSVTTTSVSVVYSPTVPTENISTGSWTVSCTRLAGDSANLNYSIAADNGLQPAAGSNRVRRGATANYYNYEIYRLTPYINSSRWQGANRFTGTLAFGASLSASVSGTFDLRVPGSQPVVTAGTYTDTVATTLRNTTSGATLDTSSFNVSVITTNSCQVTTSPGNMSFTYTSFQVAAANSSTGFETRCTTGLPYTMALDVTSGTLLGLNYMLSLSTSSATGNGIEQAYTISGSIAAGQAGTCATASCAGSQTRTLTISY